MSQTNPPANVSHLRSVHTSNLPALFEQLGLSLAVSTYQAGKLILLRNDGAALNTHFVPFSKPMGIAADRSRISVGGASTLWHYRNMQALAPKLEPASRHDAAYVPHRIHVTGDIDIHEMAWDGDGELWAVNTKFGCLCTFDASNSFTPRWTPSFLSALAPEDRCHLNGLSMVNGKPKYVTCLGETDTAGGWRSNKRNGGILMDVDSQAILLRGLSMPHSPRWYRNKLWVLESGEGSLITVDPVSSTRKTIATMPGFTRGMDFHGPLAFIGLSQVRESAVFSGIPLVQKLRADERACGIWVVNIETGETVGFVRFEEGVQEIFAVSVLDGYRYPGLLEWEDPRIPTTYLLPDDALARVRLPTEEELRAKPAYHFELGVKHGQDKAYDEAIGAFRECLRLDPLFPSAAYNLGVCLGDAGQYDEAIEHLQHAAEREPERAEIYNSLGYIHARRGEPQESLRQYELAISRQPDYAQAHFNFGMCLLQQGDYERGWAEYAWRWKTGAFTPFQCPQPRWDGKPAPEKILLLHTEQGAGDAIQFSRYVSLAAQRVKRVLLVAPDNLLELFGALDGVAELRPSGAFNLRDFDTWAALMDLPHLFGTTPETIPQVFPGFDLAALRRRSNEALVLPDQGRKRIGIVWAGSPTHAEDRSRSCRLEDFLPLLKLPNHDFFSLQVGPREHDLQQLPADVAVTNLSPQLGSYADTALAVSQLDRVIGVDTSVVHLSAALGIPTWTLLAQMPDWRWGLETDSTPWYPSMRLFRQLPHDHQGDWSSVVARVASALAQT